MNIEIGQVRTFVGQHGLARRGKTIRRWATFTVIGRNRNGYICRADVGGFDFGLGDLPMSRMTLPGVHKEPPLTCKQCGCEFKRKGSGGHRHYCDDCAAQRIRDRKAREAAAKRYARHCEQGPRPGSCGAVVSCHFEIPHVEAVHAFVVGRWHQPANG